MQDLERNKKGYRAQLKEAEGEAGGHYGFSLATGKESAHRKRQVGIPQIA